MKKCASCTKDLPEAALHCVFCGAKQPPAPAVQPGLAKTAFGYSNEMMEHLKNQAPPSSGPGPYAPPAPPAPQPPRYPPSSPPYGGGLAPSTNPNAATMFVQGGPPNAAQRQHPPSQPPQPAQNNAAFMQTAVSPPQPQYQQPQYPQPVPQPMAPPMNMPGMGVQGPQSAYGAQPIAPAPYLGAARMHNANAPIEPWKDALPMVMIAWGIATLVAFAIPVSIHPLAFNWDMIIHGEGLQKLPMLVVAALGLLGVVIGAIPMGVVPRGILAALLGISTVLVPVLALGVFPPWQALVPMIGVALIIPGQLVRNEYVESTLSRVLVTIGVVAVLLPLVVPDHGEIPLVSLLKGLINGHVDSTTIILLATIVFVVVNLLVWLPGPATAGGKVFAWIWILAPFIVTAVELGAHAGEIPDIIKQAPATLVAWVPMTTAAAFIGYGLATVFGKQLE